MADTINLVKECGGRVNTLCGELHGVHITCTPEELEAFRKRIEDEMKEKCATKVDEFYFHIRQYTTDILDIGDRLRDEK